MEIRRIEATFIRGISTPRRNWAFQQEIGRRAERRAPNADADADPLQGFLPAGKTNDTIAAGEQDILEHFKLKNALCQRRNTGYVNDIRSKLLSKQQPTEIYQLNFRRMA